MKEPMLIKKESFTDKLITKQKRILIVSVFAVLFLFVGSSYALLTNFDKTDEVVTITTGNLNMSINNTAGLINLEGEFPTSDADALESNSNIISLTLTNSGTIDIMKYDVKLVNDESKTSTLNHDHIKYAIKDGATFQTPKILSSNNDIIYTGYNLGVGEGKTIYLKVWIDEDAGNDALGKEFYGSITVDLYQKADLPGYVKVLEAAVKTGTCANKTTVADTDDFGNPMTYISGTKTCIDFNYVWYSGKMWRIVAIYNDGSMKLVTDNNITNISYNYPDTETWFYKTDTGAKSYMYQWLNEDFLDTLVDYDEIIDTTKYWNATMTNSGIDVIKPAEYDENGKLLSTMIPSSIAKVGLLNGYEYSKSYQENVYSIGYLNIGYYFWLLNPTGELSAYGTGSIGEVTNQGYYSGDFPIVVRGVRPSIIVKPGVSFSSGSGLYNDPYIITTTNKATGRENELINSRISGEYIKFKSEGVGDNYDAAPLYRIVGIEDDNKITKIVSMNYATYDNGGKTANTKGYGVASDAGTTYGNGTTNETWDYYLNNTWYNNLSFKDKLISSTYYIGKVGNSGSYKLSICSVATTDTTSECAKTLSNTFNVGLLRYGEMFATQQGNGNSIDMWLITKYSSWSVWIASNSGTGDGNHPPNPCAVRPSYHLKSNVKIISGSGTFDDPYIVD